jgi:glycosyltransferase involved in cell wall biosynthesis
MKPAVMILEQQAWRGGAQRVLEVGIESLREDFECVVVFPDDGPFAEAVRQHQSETAFYPLGEYRAGQKSWREVIAFVPRTLACAVKLAVLILKRNIRLVYINGPRCLPAGALAARLTGRPALFHLHQTLQRPIDVWVAAQTSRWVSSIVACSHAAAQSLTRRRPELAQKVQVLYNPVRGARSAAAGNPKLFSHAVGAHPFTIGIVGRVTAAKGFHVLVEAAGKLCQNLRKDLRLLIVGTPAPGSAEDEAYHRELISSVSTSGLERETIWAGYLPDPHPAYAAMDVLVVPSILPEGLSLAALEAMQHGVPVIASAAGGVLEVVRDGKNGILVPPGDVSALAAALEMVWADPSLRARLSEGARATVDSRFAPGTFKKAIHRTLLELTSCSATLKSERFLGS